MTGLRAATNDLPACLCGGQPVLQSPGSFAGVNNLSSNHQIYRVVCSHSIAQPKTCSTRTKHQADKEAAERAWQAINRSHPVRATHR